MNFTKSSSFNIHQFTTMDRYRVKHVLASREAQISTASSARTTVDKQEVRREKEGRGRKRIRRERETKEDKKEREVDRQP